jgi:hypothetical protein
MKKIIKKSETKCSDALAPISTDPSVSGDLSYYDWKSFLSFFKNNSLNMMGFSTKEVRVIEQDDDKIAFEVRDEIADDFLTSLAEASGIDYTSYTFKIFVTDQYIKTHHFTNNK